MATATAAPAQSQAATPGASRHTHAAPRPSDPSQPPSSPSIYAAEVEPDEVWVRQLQEEQRVRFNQQAAVMHREYLLEVEREGPFASPDTRTALLKRYEERLERLRVMQMEELESHIEMERQERLWSLGLEDNSWEGWNGVIQEQVAILANIRRTATLEAEASFRERIQERIRENARETEDDGRRSEEWQRTEPQRMADRARWAERTRLTNAHVGERRQRDLAEAENQAAQTRAREEHLRETLTAQAESLPSSRSDNLFSASSGGTDAAPSSAFGERLRPSPAVSIPLATNEARFPSNTDHAPPADDVRRTSPVRLSPHSGTPMASQTMAYAKGEESARPAVWIPPEGTREPTRKSSSAFDSREPVRKSSGAFDGHEPTRKSSSLFNAPEPARRPSMQFTFGTQEESTRRSFQTSSPPLHQSQPPSQSQPQNAPSMRPTAQQRPATGAFPQSRATEASTVPSLSGTTTAARPTASTTTYPTQATRSTPIPPSTRSAPAPSQSKDTQDPAEERRRQLRERYTREEPQRVEEERRRREDQENERRAEEARRRGAEKRRAEEEARDAERREAERKETERRARAGLPKLPVKAVDIAEAWDIYEKQWSAMASATQLRFRSIPWPVPTQVLEPTGLIPGQIGIFIMSPRHSQGKTRKDRLKEALLRWHPDRFEAKWLQKVIEEERESVKEGVGLVVRALNELLSTEGTFAA